MIDTSASVGNTSAVGDGPPVLRVRGLVKRFGDLTAVDSLDLEVREREVFGLLGPNGAGKTTTIRIICGELRPDAGDVMLDGRPLSGRTDDPARVGLCPQEIVIWHQLTCLEQLQITGRLYGLPRRAARERARRLLADLGLGAQERTLAGRLSGGRQRRLNIALALVHEPELVILDEPGAGLDPQSRVLVREFIRGLADSSTVVVTTHEMDEAERLCDRVAIVDHGRLLTCGSPAALAHELGAPEVIELHLPEPGGTAALQTDPVALVARVAGVPPSEIAVRQQMLVLRSRHAVDILPDLMRELSAIGARPDDVRLRGASLEDVFLKLTGKELRP
jgi:ABC-2 type transport system ATP-binding protein